MFLYINTFYFIFSKLFYVLFFCYLYYPIYTNCNIQKKIKKNGKTKIISEPKSVLALINLILLYFLFNTFTFKMLLFIIIFLMMCSLVLYDRISPQLNNSLYKFNKSSIMIVIWKLLHTIFTLIYVITRPFFTKINNYIGKKINFANNIINQIANLSSDNDFKKELSNIKENTLNISNMSNMSDYIYKTNEHKSSIELDDTLKEEINIMTDETNTSKSKMIKKMDEINQVINKIDNEIEDLMITQTEN